MINPEDNILELLQKAGKSLSVVEIFDLNKDFENKLDLTQQLLEMIADQTIEAAELNGVRKYALNGVLNIEAPTEPVAQVECAVRTQAEEARTAHSTDTADAVATEPDESVKALKNTKIYKVLKHLEVTGDWVNAKDIAKEFGVSCGADALKTHIKAGAVLLENRGRGMRMVKLAPDWTAIGCVLNAFFNIKQGLADRHKKPTKNHTKPAKALEVPVFLAQQPAQVGCAVRTGAEEVRTAHPSVLPEKSLRQLLGWANDGESTITEVPTPHLKPFRIAFTSDACLILQNANMGSYQADIELDAEQTRTLVEFIQTADIEALI